MDMQQGLRHEIATSLVWSLSQNDRGHDLAAAAAPNWRGATDSSHDFREPLRVRFVDRVGAAFKQVTHALAEFAHLARDSFSYSENEVTADETHQHVAALRP